VIADLSAQVVADSKLFGTHQLTNSPTHHQTMDGTSWQPTSLKSSDLVTISRIFDIELEEVSYAQVANNHDAEINQHHH
jgi:hypothetical protein